MTRFYEVYGLLLLLVLARLPGLTAQQGSTGALTLVGEGPAEAGQGMLRVLKVFESRLAVSARVFYRITTSVASATSVAADAAMQTTNSSSALQFAITERPLSTTQRANFTGNSAVVGDSLHFPLYVNAYGLYYNVPGNRITALNITACLAARILKGDILEWTHPDFLDKNPTFIKAATDSYKIAVLVDSATSGATVAVLDWLAKACPATPVTYATLRTDAVVVGGNMINSLQATPFSFGWAMGAVGRAAAVSEFAVETSTAGRYLLTGATNTTNMNAALVKAIPTALTGDYSSASVNNLAASNVAPILTVGYLVTKSDWSKSSAEEGQRGELLQALCSFFHSSAASSSTGLLSEIGLLPVGDATIAAVKVAAATAFTRHPTAIAFTSTDGNAANVVSSTRSSFEVAAYAETMTAINALKSKLDVGAARVMRGAGSSAVTLFIWRVFSELKARSTTSVHMVYRAAGSGAGANEVLAKANKYQAFVDFGASDTPMSDAVYTELTATAKVQVVHIPILLAPMNFFVNIPESVLPTRLLKMSPCTIAKVMQADITSWAHPDISADNAGAALPDQPIIVYYRQLGSGTTAVITEYLTRACPSWRLGSSSLLSNWPPTFKPTANAVNMSTSVATTPWSVGYMDAANGLELNLMEIAMQNKDGNFVTSQTGDIPAAASALFKSDAWPKSPTQSFSSVSVLNQPGANVFPIVAMPFMFIRTDLTSRGDAGALLQAFLTFMLDSYAQNTLAKAVGFEPLPAEVRQYAVERALPLLQIDTRSKAWTFENGAVLSAGRGSTDNVISSFAGSYENTNSQAFADFYKAYSLSQNKKSADSANTTNGGGAAMNLTGLADVPANLKSKLDDMDKQIQILQAIAITGTVFGVIGLALSIFFTCRMFVHSSLWGGQGANALVHPGSMTMGSSVRRQKSSGNLSESSFH